MSIYVERLVYNVDTPEGINMPKNKTMDFTFNKANFHLEDKLEITFQDRILSVNDARLQVEPFLYSWEILADIIYETNGFHFSFSEAIEIDEDNPKNKVVNCTINVVAAFSISAKCEIMMTNFPAPPYSFSTNSDVDTLLYRFLKYREGKELLTNMGYFCFSYLKMMFGSIERISSELMIKKDVIRKLSELTSTRGDRYTSRKASDKAFIPLSNNEIKWIENCIKKIIIRVGEYTNDPTTLKQITMSDFITI